jgi:pyruvate kinase
VLEGIPPIAERITIQQGDSLLVCGDERPGAAEVRDPEGVLLKPGRVQLPIDAVYRDARTGETIWFDDGRIGGVIQAVEDRCLKIRVTRTRRPRERLGADRGVNLPDTALRLPALSAEDLADLDFIARHADLVSLSFVNSAGDIQALRQELLARDGGHLALIAKIETRRGFQQLPGILLAALQFPACGVMIARGDLAVECGFERLAEIQEQILWVCEAAHVPVIWATQVLEGLTKQGLASRAEITDAAMSQAAECVMLNKGPYVEAAVRTLDDILQRMQLHRSKKRSMLRRLRLADWKPASEGGES